MSCTDIYKGLVCTRSSAATRRSQAPNSKLPRGIIRITKSPNPKYIAYRLSLLVAHGLDILGGKDGVLVNGALASANMAVGVGIELSSAVGEVEVDWVGPCNEDCVLLVCCSLVSVDCFGVKLTEDERNAHSMSGTDLIGNVTEDGWDNSTSTD